MGAFGIGNVDETMNRSRNSQCFLLKLSLAFALVQSVRTACFLAAQCDCTNSYNNLAVVDCSKRDLQTMPTIKVLNNAIYSIDLSYNSITTLPSFWFSQSFASVQSVSIVNNPLTTISSSAFISTTISQLSVSYFAGSSIGSNPSFSWVALSPILSTLVSLKISGYYVPILPQSSVTNALNLVTLVLSNNQIGSITTGSFAGLSSLQSLDLSANNLVSIPTSVIGQLPALKTLILSNNQIRMIVANSIPLNGLTYLDLSWNFVQQIQAYSFQSNTATLTYLDLTRNYLNDTNAPGLTGFTALQTLIVGQNQFVNVGNLLNQCCSQSAVLSLDLSQNQVSQLSSSSFSVVAATLSSLVLDNNIGLANIASNTFVSFQNLTVLQANGVSWPSVLQQSPTVFSSASILAQTLTGLYLNDAELTAALLPAISTLTSLKVLSLQYNEIAAIPPLFFAKFSSLTQLSLNSDSQLTQVGDRAIYGLQSLQILDLSYTECTQLSVCINLWLPRLQRINLVGVPLVCDCNLIWLKNWTAAQAESSNVQAGSEYICASPSALAGQYVINIPVTQFTCSAGQTQQSITNCTDLDAVVLQSAVIPFNVVMPAKAGENATVTVPNFAPYSNQIHHAYATAYNLDTGSTSNSSSVLSPTSDVSFLITVWQSGNYQFCVLMVTPLGSTVQSGSSCVNKALSPATASASLVIIIVPIVCGVVVIIAVVVTVVLVLKRRKRAQRSRDDPFKVNQPSSQDMARIGETGTRFTKRPPKPNGNGTAINGDNSANEEIAAGSSASLPGVQNRAYYENTVMPIRPPRAVSGFSDNRAFSSGSLTDDNKSSIYHGTTNFGFAQSTTTIDTHESIPLPKRPQAGAGTRLSIDRPDTTYEELPDEHDRIYTKVGNRVSNDPRARNNPDYAPAMSQHYAPSPHSQTLPADGRHYQNDAEDNARPRVLTWNSPTANPNLNPIPIESQRPTSPAEYLYEDIQPKTAEI